MHFSDSVCKTGLVALGTEIRKRYGLEAAQVILGHASADVTQIYAERDLQKAVEIMREVG
jgi:integrase